MAVPFKRIAGQEQQNRDPFEGWSKQVNTCLIAT
jgi:hypothetical protein